MHTVTEVSSKHLRAYSSMTGALFGDFSSKTLIDGKVYNSHVNFQSININSVIMEALIVNQLMVFDFLCFVE